MSDGNYTPRERRTFWAAFLAGVALVVGYAVYSLWPQSFEPNAAIAQSDFPKVEITVAGEANGVIEITLRPDLAPQHVERIITLAKEGTYDNVVFHRVIDGFMAQAGDVEFGKADGNGGRAGMGGSTYPDLPAEFTEEPYVAGTVGMARSQNPNSANSQFFIMFAPGDFLNGQYTVVGNVTSGFDVVQAIKRGEGPNGSVLGKPDVMTSMRVVE
ncbi:peptidylprolyl isomerase [Aliiroseovarius halocynthiae]|uniref:Peptidyl-prolyl cis-trans isomerase n=1 Tax=Aliiroseovarius halocynthiae TaxID=985055 RepID=A0A545SWV0_9RHOB|nr:peptidylprolyl isomerase [Aliiroseovarius halocynthiae]TQV69424.1 peptidylprolyl isomerase [Aliiroseovarius halocynthiae]SMR72817.1 peptidylprolyl isomerase [Aliiroseovarius halocynthiae]